MGALTAAARATTVPVLQLAADGSWETASVVGLGDGAIARAALAQVAATASRDIAVEVLWPGQSFVGVRWRLDEFDAAAAGLAAASSLSEAKAGREATPASALLTLLGGKPGPRVDLVQLGAVNAWASTGPETLWQHSRPSTRCLHDLPTRRPDLVRCAHPVAVEIAAADPRPCWIGIVVSRPAGTVHLLDPTAVADIVALATSHPS